MLGQVVGKMGKLVKGKCSIPSFKNYDDLEMFQKQMLGQISTEYTDNEFKWVNYMD